MKKAVLFFVVIFLILSVSNVFAQRGSARGEIINIRFASPLPRNSDWGRALDRLAGEWERVTNNGVRVIVAHDSREGSEARMYNSLSSDAIQAGIFTSIGMSEICPPIMTLSMPFMIRDEAEFDIVIKEIKPVLEKRVKNDFVVIAWSKGGWIYIFSKDRVLTLEDMRKQKMATNEDQKEMNQAFRLMGFQLEEVDYNSLAPKLTNNTITSLYFTPAAIAPMQLHKYLGNMLNMPICPFLGAIVMNRVTWNKLSPAQQQEIARVTAQVAAEFDISMPKAESNAVLSMSNGGLKINTPSKSERDIWEREVNKITATLVGSLFDREVYQTMNNVLVKSRAGNN